MTSPDGSNFSYTESSIAANLTLNIPNDAVDTLQQVAQFAGEIQVNWESSVRLLQDYSSYLQSLPNIQRQVNDLQREYLQTLKDTQSTVDSMRTSGGFVGPQIPQGMGVGSAAAFGAAGYAVGTQTSDRMVPVGQNAGQSVAATTASSMEAQAQRDSAVYGQVITQGGLPGSGLFVMPGQTNASASGYPLPHSVGGDGGYIHPGTPAAATQAQHHRAQEVARQAAIQQRRDINPNGSGRHSAFEEDEEEGTTSRGGSAKKSWSRNLYNMVQQAGVAESQFAGAIGPGGTPLASRAALGGNLLGSLSEMAPWMKGLGAAGLGVGAAGLAWNAIQGAGESIQGFRNQDVHQNSLAGGMKVQGDIMSMAMNPFISTEQAREIVMSGLNAGYSGKAYDNVVDFMKDNLVDMNLKVADSVKLLHSNVEIGRQSIEGLKIDLATVRMGAATGAKTQEEAAKQYTKVSDFFYDQNGATGPGGSAAALFGTYMFADINENGDPNPLHEHADDITIAILSSEPIMLMLYQKHPGIVEDPMDIVGALGDERAITEAYEYLAGEAKRAGSKQRFQRRLTALDIQLSKGDAYNLYDQLIGGQIISNAQKKKEETLKSSVGGETKKDPSSMLTEQQWRTNNGLSTQSEDITPDQHDEYMKSQGLDPNKDASGYSGELAALAAGGHTIVITPDGQKVPLNPYANEQIIGLSNPNSGWKLAHTDEDLLNKYGISYDTSGRLSLDNFDYQGDSWDGSTSKDINGMNQMQVEIEGQGSLQDYINSGATQTENGKPDPRASTGSSGDGPQGLRSNGTTFTAPSSSSSSTPGTIDFAPWAKQFLQWSGLAPGSVDRSPNSEASNTGYGGAQRNSSPPGMSRPK